MTGLAEAQRSRIENGKRPQLRHLLKVAVLPHVVIQVVPECWHSGISGGFILTDSAAYSESVVTGQAYGGGDETIRTFARRFDNIGTEAMRASESTALLREMIGRDRLTQEPLQGLKARGSAARAAGIRV